MNFQVYCMTDSGRFGWIVYEGCYYRFEGENCLVLRVCLKADNTVLDVFAHGEWKRIQGLKS